MSRTFIKQVAVCAIYLSIGLEDAVRAGKGEYPSGHDGSHLECSDILAEAAVAMAGFLCDPQRVSVDFPGVFHYEVTEGLGAWLATTSEATPAEFSAELERRFNLWIWTGEADSGLFMRYGITTTDAGLDAEQLQDHSSTFTPAEFVGWYGGKYDLTPRADAKPSYR